MSKFIPTEQFKTVVEYAPLISIDLVTIYQDKVLLGKRVNKPAFGFYFTTGGIVRKNESFKDAQKRIAKDELGIELTQKPKFIGVFEHFYYDSIFEDISTHYVNHGYLLELDKELKNIPQEQHSIYKWFTIKELMNSNEVHKYVKDYFKFKHNRRK
ncbi:MAG TPA: NUDIX domain-containing protein [Sulfurimonas sp.]|uniref:GDP-mannose mannosyl hydrolase n=1 Tax=Sulfurimonas sp. TaxID=2022749 RepID=UPI002C3E3004|nr:NUDIX domain-containing protein [Sulfurimonas sp.]HUH42896.1 NUDIX domain-containing protein [Sulfurimonas sp.]